MSDENIIIAGILLLTGVSLWVGWGFCAEFKKEEISKLKKRISDLETLCRFDDIPEFLIEHPTFIKGQKPTEKQMEWGLKKAQEWLNKNQAQ